MFAEDTQWNAGTPDPFEENLHRQLFGEVKQADTTGGSAKRRKKRKREKETCTSRDSELGGDIAGRLSEDSHENEITSGKRKTTKSEKVRAQQQTASNKRQKKQTTLDQNEKGDTYLVTTDQLQNGTSPPQSHHVRTKHNQSSKLYAKMSSQLEGSHFRMINQKLYTSTGKDAKLMFDSEPELFEVYHRGFSTQVSKWPLNPLNRIIDHIRTLPESLVVCDFGCGEARLAESVQQRVHSFDLVAINSRVTACDMAHVPLKKHTVDICVFCLSLMGTNVSDFILEARRVIKREGELRICEVSSRFLSVGDFVQDVEAFGFKLKTMTEFSKMFLELVFTAVKREAHSDLPQISLKPCIYKRR